MSNKVVVSKAKLDNLVDILINKGEFMKQYKKLLALGLVAFSLFSCGRKNESNNERN